MLCTSYWTVVPEKGGSCRRVRMEPLFLWRLEVQEQEAVQAP